MGKVVWLKPTCLCLFTKFFSCQNHPQVLKNIFYYFKIIRFGTSPEKTAFRRKNSHTGGGGFCPRGNFSHLIPFLFLKASLSMRGWVVTYLISGSLFASVNVLTRILMSWALSGLPKDVWELSQMLGRGGRDGQQAAFVIMFWVGQAGLYLFHDVDISITSASSSFWSLFH